MLEFIIAMYGTQIITAIFCLVAGAVAVVCKKIWQRYANDATKETVAKNAVKFVEQTWKTIHGKDKLEKALQTAEMLLKKKKIPFDAEEMMVVIEAAVAEFNDVFKREETEPEAGQKLCDTDGETNKAE